MGFNLGGSGPSHVGSEAEQSERLLEDLEQAQVLGEAGWLKALVVYADNEETWNIYGKPAGTTYQNFANAHGLGCGVAFTAHFAALSTLNATLTS